MATIPAGNFGNAPVPVARAPQQTMAGVNAMGDAIGRLGQIGAEVAARINDNQRAVKIAGASTEAAMGLEEFALGMQTDRDYGTQYDRYQQYVADVDKQYQQRFEGDNTAYSTWKNEFGVMAFKKGIELRKASLTGQVDQQRGQIRTNLSALSELAVAGDDEQQGLVRAKASLLIEEAYQGGIYSADDAAKARLDFQDELVGAQVRKDILFDPDTAAEKLLLGQYGGLSGTQQMMWLDKANAESEARLRKQVSQQERAQKAIDKEDKLTRDDTAKDGDRLLAGGEMSTDWLEQNRENLNPDDYRYFYKALSDDGGAVTDRNLYGDLRLRASNGEDVRDDARAALRRNQLALPDYDKLVNRSEENAGGANLPNWYKRGEQYIGRALRVSDINPDPAAAQRQAAAMDAWTEWAENNNDTDEKVARDAYQRITREYALINYESMTLTKPLPRYAVGDRMALDIPASMQATVDAYRAGTLSQEEFEKQAQLLTEWETATQQMKGAGQ